MSFLSLALVLSPSVPVLRQEDPVAPLLPTDTAVLVRIESARAWDELVRELLEGGDEASAYEGLQGLLDSMAESEVAPEERARLDLDAPLHLAVSFTGGSNAVTLVAPVVNARPLRIHGEILSAPRSSLHGNLAVVTNHAEEPGHPSTTPLLAQLPPGLLSARVDLATILATFRPLIDMGLQQAEMAIDSLPQGGPFDLEPLFEAYLDAARDFLDSALALDVVLERDGDELTVRITYTQRTERAPAQTGDPAPLLACIDADSTGQVAFTGRAGDAYRQFGDLAEAALSMYPQPLRGDLERMVDLQLELDALMEPGIAASFDFGEQGMRACYVLRSSQPEELIGRFVELMRSLDHEGGLVRVGAASALEVDGLQAQVLPLEIQFASMMSAFQSMQPDVDATGGELDAEARQELEDMFGTLYGHDLRLALAHAGPLVLVSLANDEEVLRRDLGRLRAPGTPSPRMQRLLARIEPGAMGVAYHIELGRGLARMLEAFRTLAPDEEPISFTPTDAALGFFISQSGARWSFGAQLQLSELRELGRALAELEDR
ncbi:MAG TPA: hypothetical protein VF530_11760 [Planctomycetota bacterium]